MASVDDSGREPAARRGWRGRRLPLSWKILAGLVIGAVAGLVANGLLHDAGAPSDELAWFARTIAGPVGQIFLRLIFMVVVPLVVTALVLGIVQMGDVRRLGRMGLRALGMTLLLSCASVAIGVTLVNTLRPGDRLSPEKKAELRALHPEAADRAVANARQAKKPMDAILDIIPRNPLQEMVGALDGSSPGGGMLSVMFFAVVLGIALTSVGARGAPLVAALEGLHEALMAVIGFAMRLAPFGVAALAFTLTSLLGFDILVTLAGFVATVIVGLLIQQLGTYSVVLLLLARTNPLRFMARAGEALLTAFATASSNVTLPTALRVAQEKLSMRRDVSSFVLTVGATANQNGTALFEGVTVLFLAQVFGVDLTTTQQVTVVLMSILAGVGTAGVPGGSLPLIVLVLQSVNVPGEAIGIVLGVDRILDMCRTTVNVTGDLAIAAVVDRAERGSGEAAAEA